MSLNTLGGKGGRAKDRARRLGEEPAAPLSRRTGSEVGTCGRRPASGRVPSAADSRRRARSVLICFCPLPTSDRPWRLGAASTAVFVAPGPSPIRLRLVSKPPQSAPAYGGWGQDQEPGVLALRDGGGAGDQTVPPARFHLAIRVGLGGGVGHRRPAEAYGYGRATYCPRKLRADWVSSRYTTLVARHM
jgi:hypothetical protein